MDERDNNETDLRGWILQDLEQQIKFGFLFEGIKL